MGEWSKAWARDDLSRHSFLQVAGSKERARELAVINLPAETRYFLIPFENGEWGWLCGAGVEMCVTPVAHIRRGKIYTVEGCRCQAYGAKVKPPPSWLSLQELDERVTENP